MKLAILCAYRLRPEQRPLLELQLRQIARLTTVPYTLYAAPVGLSEPLRERLRSEPRTVLGV